jgi:hypothetical protein
VCSWATVSFQERKFTVSNNLLRAQCVDTYDNFVNVASIKSFRKFVKRDFYLLRFCLSVIPHECLRVFQTSVEKIHFGLKSEQNHEYCM